MFIEVEIFTKKKCNSEKQVRFYSAGEAVFHNAFLIIQENNKEFFHVLYNQL